MLIRYLNLKSKTICKIHKIKDHFSGTIFYDKEFNHSCSHYINLMNFWFGKYISHQKLKVYKRNEYDAKIDVKVNFKNASIKFANTKYKTKKEFNLKSGHFKITKNKDQGLIINNKLLPHTMKNYQENFYKELYKYAINKKHNLADFKEILYNAKIIDKILKN